MILGPVSYLDCIVFCIFLTPQLLWQVGLFDTVFCVLRALPFLLFRLPLSFVYERFRLSHQDRSPFVQIASPFEDLVVRCVRYAFAHIPPRIGRVFFSKAVALPFLRFRMLRHGYIRSPIHWREYQGNRFKGIWLITDPLRKPDLVIYYAHGGGFSMGSSYFYLEFLMAWQSLLAEAGYANPAIFALEYTLVPDSSFPTQLRETIAAYEHVLSMAGDASRVCVSGDSAGATLILGLLLHLGHGKTEGEKVLDDDSRLRTPGLSILISPWVTLASSRHHNTPSDYLDVESLHRYGLQYAGSRVSSNDPMVSPGSCKDLAWWKRAGPAKGIYVAYGKEEVFAPEIEEMVRVWTKAGVIVGSHGEVGGIHAWPVASLFLSNTADKRLKGLRSLVEKVREQIPSST